MAKASPLQSNFNAGEVDPRMVGRVDFDRMRSALKICKNSIPRITGSWTRRPGTYLCDEVKDSTKATRVVKFKYSTIQAYVLEFGDQYIRFKKDRGPIYDLALTITAVTAANPPVVTYTGTDPSNGDHLDIAGVVGMTELNGRRFRVANVNGGANTLELQTVDAVNVNGTAFTAYSSAGVAERVYTLSTVYLEADLFELKFTQSADTLYIWHPDYPERTLVRASDSSWTIPLSTFLDGPYLPVNVTATTLTPGAATGAGVTLTASAVTGINSGQGFLTTDVGRLIRIKEGSVWGYVLITARTNTTVVTVTIINTLTNVSAKVNWRLGLYSDTTGYPSCGSFYGDRLYRGGSAAMPDRFDGSKVGDYLNMAVTAADGTVADDNAVSFRLNSDDVQSIRWMRGTGNGLAIGTFEGEWLVSPSTNVEAITPTNVSAKQSTPYGSANIQPVRVGTVIIFVESGGRRVREMNYLYYENLLQSPDMTILAEHITKGDYDPATPLAGASTVARSGVKELDFQKKTIPVVWAVRNDGVLLGLTYSKDEKVMGWHRHILGGYSNVGHTAPAEVESCCVIPATDGSYDELWLVVKRYLNGRQVRMNEYLTPTWEQGQPQADATCLDSLLTYDGTPTTTITGLYHLAGETVQVLADGGTHPDVVVSATGSIALTRSASVVHVGYAYSSDASTLRFDAGAEDGTAQGKTQRIHRVAFRLYETNELAIGSSLATLTSLNFRSASVPMGTATPLFTGDRDESWPDGYSTEALICWRCRSPLPAEVLAVMPVLATQGR